MAGVSLQLLVVDDPDLATAAGQFRGEWNALTGSDFHVESTSREELADAETLAADAVICPSCRLGPLAERKLVIAMPKELRQSGAGDWSDLFELLRTHEAVWGTDILAVPFGSPVLTCYYRADLLERLGRGPPSSWAEYQQLAELLADRGNLGDSAPPDDAPWSGTIEPLGPGWAGLVLLARAAPYAKHRDNYSTLFDIRTMEPLVAGPPFVRALEELVAAAKVGSPEQLQCDPAAARAAFWQGRCGMALTWPTGATGESPTDVDVSDNVRVGFAELPGSTRVYNVGNRSWENRAEDADPHVPLLSIAGRIGAVSRASAHPQAAFQLLLWLSGGQISRQVSAYSPATTLFRKSHVESPTAWVEKPISPAAAAKYGALAQATLHGQQGLSAPRIPARSEYLSALDAAVRQAVRGEKPAAEALQHAADRWRKITRRLSVEKQKAAYTHGLGLD